MLKVGFFSWAHTGLETPLLAGHPHRGMGSRERLWMSITGGETCRSSRSSLRWHTVARIPAGGRLTALANIANGQCRDGGPELVIRCKYSVIPVPMLARQLDQIREPF